MYFYSVNDLPPYTLFSKVFFFLIFHLCTQIYSFIYLLTLKSVKPEEFCRDKDPANNPGWIIETIQWIMDLFIGDLVVSWNSQSSGENKQELYNNI